MGGLARQRRALSEHTPKMAPANPHLGINGLDHLTSKFPMIVSSVRTRHDPPTGEQHVVISNATLLALVPGVAGSGGRSRVAALSRRSILWFFCAYPLYHMLSCSCPLLAREAVLRAESLARFGKQRRDTYLLLVSRLLRCSPGAVFLFVFLLSFLAARYFAHPHSLYFSLHFVVLPNLSGPSLYPSGARGAASDLPSRAASKGCPECGGDQSSGWVPPAAAVVPTAWVRLGAQPDGPIPRFWTHHPGS